ncbi:uncharacterized protein B0T23DRAFT_153018 [Neurospora hispaniola]|uniref:Uncharacterized protein n=1 Tax=Neurospora hispaniola TaxID=588809 RepID=A0AAJ0MRR9_9PEZI|nr:hypothetical protein B0T23DRAFT_153018 [Neurospora hispaniola]
MNLCPLCALSYMPSFSLRIPTWICLVCAWTCAFMCQEVSVTTALRKELMVWSSTRVDSSNGRHWKVNVFQRN